MYSRVKIKNTIYDSKTYPVNDANSYISFKSKKTEKLGQILVFLNHQDSNLSCLVQLFNVKQAIKCPKSDDVVAFKVELTESRKRIKTHSNTLADP